MQGVGLQGLAVVFPGHPAERARAPYVHGDGEKHHGEGGSAGLDLHTAKEKALDRLVGNPGASQQEQAGLKKGRKALHFAVAVLMIGISRLVGNAHGEKSDKGRDQVEAGVRGLGQNAQGARGQAHNNLQGGDAERGQDRAARDGTFVAAHGLQPESALNFRHVGHYRCQSSGRQGLLLSRDLYKAGSVLSLR
jgi:hypothetical protein